MYASLMCTMTYANAVTEPSVPFLLPASPLSLCLVTHIAVCGRYSRDATYLAHCGGAGCAEGCAGASAIATGCAAALAAAFFAASVALRLSTAACIEPFAHLAEENRQHIYFCKGFHKSQGS